MSAVDLFISQYLKTYGLPLFALIWLSFVIVSNFSIIRNKLIARTLSRFDASFDRLMVNHKKNLFMPLHDIVSADWKLRNKGLIRILEIGFRTGENVKYYPKNSHLLIVDRNMYLQSYLKSNPALIGSMQIEKIIISSLGELRDIPDNSVDAVIGTFILCSVPCEDQLLKEIKRVLSPGGLYFYIEHIAESRGTSLQKLQNILSVTRLWPALFDGCHLNRCVEKSIKCAEFSDFSYQYVTLNSEDNFLSKFMRTHIIGTAVK